jgi:UDP-N-acetylmuramyl tripeptide synthase
MIMIGISKSKPTYNTAQTKCIGITGTLGKTVVSNIIIHVLKQSGFRVAYLTSDGYSLDGETDYKDYRANHIKANVFKELIKNVMYEGVDFFIVEMTSKNIRKKVYTDILLDAAVITNIIGDPENYKNWEMYAETKFEFIKLVDEGGLLVINGEDPDIHEWLEFKSPILKQNIYTYWANVSNLQNRLSTLYGTSFNYGNISLNSSMLGTQTYMNKYLAIKICQRYLSDDQISKAISSLTNFDGKFHLVKSTPNYVFIDSANRPESIKSAIRSLNMIKPTKSRIISIVGSPGYSRYSRELADPATELSDIVIFAPTDPNTEHTYNINSELHFHSEKKGGILLERFSSTDELNLINKENLLDRLNKVIKNGDKPILTFDAHDYTGRLDAIKFGHSILQPGDVLYIAGKGNDDFIIFNNVEYEWSDYEALNIAEDTSGE